MELRQQSDQKPQQDLQQRIGQQRVWHIVDSYLLRGDEAAAFETYLHDLLTQYPHGLIELALADTLIKSWLTVPMKKGIPFLTTAHRQIQQWQAQQWQIQQAQVEQPRIEQTRIEQSIGMTRAQFYQITSLDPDIAFASLEQIQSQTAPTATESATGA